jgi:hypothetical protein
MTAEIKLSPLAATHVKYHVHRAFAAGIYLPRTSEKVARNVILCNASKCIRFRTHFAQPRFNVFEYIPNAQTHCMML